MKSHTLHLLQHRASCTIRSGGDANETRDKWPFISGYIQGKRDTRDISIVQYVRSFRKKGESDWLAMKNWVYSEFIRYNFSSSVKGTYFTDGFCFVLAKSIHGYYLFFHDRNMYFDSSLSKTYCVCGFNNTKENKC